MTVDLDLPYLSEDQLSRRAERFLREHNAWGQIPVPIEHIIDVGLQINIIPIRGLKQVCDTDAFISSDFTEISVDEPVYKHPSENRYRFSLAHEIAHYLLHRDVFMAYPVYDIEQYRAFRARISPESYDRLEGQANAMTRFILVPRARLSELFRQAKVMAEGAGFPLHGNWNVAFDYVCRWLGLRFQVSPAVIAICLERDRLVPRL